MLTHPQFDPIAIHLGPVAVRWYGLMYVTAFAAFFLLARYRLKRMAQPVLSYKELDDLIFWGVLGVVLGGRLGYAFFYQPSHFLTHPLDILAVWQGGMSFHGGFIGVAAALLLFCRRYRKGFWELADFVAPLVPLGLAAGRLGNFINGELWGRPSDVPWAMVFPLVDAVPRHPSQLYEMGLEGFALFALLWWYSARPRPTGATAGLFLAGYGCFRFLVEFTREPDSYLGLLSLGLSMGQWLSLPMILAGVGIMAWAGKRSSGR